MVFGGLPPSKVQSQLVRSPVDKSVKLTDVFTQGLVLLAVKLAMGSGITSTPEPPIMFSKIGSEGVQG